MGISCVSASRDVADVAAPSVAINADPQSRSRSGSGSRCVRVRPGRVRLVS